MEFLKNIPFSSIIIVVGSILTIFGALLASLENTKIQSDLKIKTEKISELSLKMSDMITGGDNYPYIEVGFSITKKGLINFTLVSNGMLPIYDITLVIDDHNLAKNIMDKKAALNEKVTRDDTKTWSKQIYIGNLNPQTNVEISEFMFPENINELNFTAKISARNGYIYQPIKITRDLVGFKKEDNRFKLESAINKNEKILKVL